MRKLASCGVWLVLLALDGPVDLRRWAWWSADEPFGVRGIGRVQDGSAGLVDRGGLPVVDHGRGEQADPECR
ncbi:hypothetical protein Ga0074812_108137 [Parafrankia irregularis]|uniref:Uncharacterized protein n=1 Tax=Parafrankia irregularis TaxID=795642 RepID=A0A0S4QLY3_9ACTN|nr:hypothetical protein Ga0074812_108137 [Parafrankia irregularis]